MNATTKLDILFTLAAFMVFCSASPIMTTNTQRLRSSLASVDRDHFILYNSIRVKRFQNPEKVLPMQAITGMEPIKSNLRYLDGDDELEPAVVYPMLYESLLIFKEAFRHITVEESVLEERIKELDLNKHSFYNEVNRAYHDINSLLSNLRHVMMDFGIPRPQVVPEVVLETEVDGNICDQGCRNERNLYIHQQFNYFLDRMAYSIAAVNEGL